MATGGKSTPKRPIIGRHRRDLDRLGKYVREQAGSNPVVDSKLTTMRGLADQLDRMERDPDSSPQTFALTVQRYAELRRELIAPLPERAGLGDPSGELGESPMRLPSHIPLTTHRGTEGTAESHRNTFPQVKGHYGELREVAGNPPPNSRL
jgi:hypothetical protein